MCLRGCKQYGCKISDWITDCYDIIKKICGFEIMVGNKKVTMITELVIKLKVCNMDNETFFSTKLENLSFSPN